jgi:Cu/Zn superoxide dismutase
MLFLFVLLKNVTIFQESLSGRAVAELRGEDGKILGEVMLRETRSGLQLSGTLTGLKPGQHLGLSVHDSGDCHHLGSIFRPDQVIKF